jgi:hypothetical protein
MPGERLCNICGLRPAGSREHLPGVAAANDHPVRITYPVFSQDERSRLGHEEREERDGYVVRTICNHCNRRTGGSLGTAYKHFVLNFAGTGILDAGQRRAWVSLDAIQPLRVIKQMATMFLAAQPDLDRERWAAVREFVLRRDAKLPQNALRFYLYRNTGPWGRIVSVGGLGALFVRPRMPPAIFSEISWPP